MTADHSASKKTRQLTTTVKNKALDLGFNLVGIVLAEPSMRLNAYLAWIDREMHGTMGYLARPDRLARRRDLNVILPGVQSIVVVGLNYFAGRLPPEVTADPSRGRISNYAWGVDYHDVMTPRLYELAEWLADETGGAVQSKVYVDTGAILERDLGVSAELGFTGKNTMLINPRRGSFFFLGELLTTAALTPDQQRRTMPNCGSCARCIAACPTNAFPQPYVLDARRCISYLTIELKGWIPRDLRPLLGNWVYGCDICQDVCPFNRFAAPTAESGFAAADVASAAPPLLELLALDQAAFERRFAGSPIRRIKRQRLVRNACVAAGNWGADEAVAPLIILLDDHEPLLRGHAAWALGRIGRRDGLAAVEGRFSAETDPDVRYEMKHIVG
ncbi:MAG: tRNA epoxyqueuosine(34) reductase QueG [Anaerolineae bacterium]|nr:tRNA epoxyqueuosine(34) reductase QueG [Anaerolineae bacterium]